VERAKGIEPSSSAWEAEVMAIIRRPQSLRVYRVLVLLASIAAKLSPSEIGAAVRWFALPATYGFHLTHYLYKIDMLFPVVIANAVFDDSCENVGGCFSAFAS
jgi:hypothetical protein